MIKRELYLTKIRPFYDNFELIKIITGIRRSGKSILLKQIREELLTKGVEEQQIIYLNFEDLDTSKINTAELLNDYVKNQTRSQDKHYLFFDEIQNVQNFELVINSLRATNQYSIFITGSNSKLLSGELATHLSGRYVSFRMFPFAFREVMTYLGSDLGQKDAVFQKYLTWGGMPQIYNLQSEMEYKTYLEDLYNSIVYRDIVDRLGLKDSNLLDKLIQFVIENLGGVFSANSIKNFLKQDLVSVSPSTLYNYLDAISSSLIINPAPRYDIRGKKVLSFYEKYYLTDLGLMQLKKSSFEKSTGGRLENIVYNELLSQGKKVYIGDNNGREIDFIVDDFGAISYYQVAQVLASPEVVEREFGALESINDNYPKFVLSLDKLDMSRNGIIHKNIVDWLLE